MAQGINIDNAAMAGKAVNAYSKDRVSNLADTSLSSGDSTSSYIFDGAPSKQTVVNKTMDQFEEYLKNQQEKAKESGEDTASQEEADNEAAKEIRRNLSSDEIKQLTMMGIDVDSARMSDLMGMVNTMRGKNHREETQELLAQIKAESGDADKLMVTGEGVKVAGTDISVDNVSVADLAETKVGDAPTRSQTAVSTRGTYDSAADFTPGKNELAYMVRNELAINKENLYKAHFSGEKVGERVMDEKTFNSISSQIEGIIDETGIDNFDMKDAKFLLDNELPVNADSIRLVAQFKDIEGKNIESLDIPENDDESVEKAAKELYKKVLYVEPEAVSELAEELEPLGKEVSIQAAYAYQTGKMKTGKNLSDKTKTKSTDADKTTAKKTKSDGAADLDNKESLTENGSILNGMTAAGITARKQLAEIQLSMTLQVANRMAKLDINVDTKSLSETLDILKQAEREILKESLANSGVDPTDENADILSETINGVETLGKSDASVLAAPLKGSAFTVRGLNSVATLLSDEAGDAEGVGAKMPVGTAERENAGQSSADGNEDGASGNASNEELRRNLQRSFESVRRSYESVGTAPRSDMGDSITKAFSNIDDLLGALDIDVNYETQRAAKILGYNNIEITQENIDGVINYDREVNRLMDNFYPEAVMGLIKDGINPMDMPIDELNDVISGKNYNEGVSEAKNFATYLRDIEKRGEISEEERSSYIGIYRVMDKLAKSGDREAGFVFANQSNLTLRNMISAMRSRKAKGIDIDVDDSFGMLESVSKNGIGMDEQIEAGFNFSNGLDAGSQTGSNSDLTDGSGLTSDETGPGEEAIRDVERFKNLDENVGQFIRENGIEYNMNNAFAVDAFLNETEGVYKLIYEAMSKLKFNDMSEENLVDEETGNMASSLMGDEVELDPAEGLQTEELLRQLGENGDLSLTYEDIRNQLVESMYMAGAAGLITSLDISVIKSATTGANLLGQLSRQDRYQIPVETEQGTTVVNLTLKNAVRGDGMTSGTSADMSPVNNSTGASNTLIEANMKTENLGNLSARISVSLNTDGSLAVKGELVSDESSGNEALQNMTELQQTFAEKLQNALGSKVDVGVSFGSSVAGTAGVERAGRGVSDAPNEGQPVNADGRAARNIACRAAVEVVRIMTEAAL